MRVTAGVLGGAFSVIGLAAAAQFVPDPIDQAELNRLVAEGDTATAFEIAFQQGDMLTDANFTLERGVGAAIGENRRFTRFPRADLAGPTEWANHFPPREGGANAMSCNACHNAPFPNGAGDVAMNAIVDPGHTGDPARYLERNTLPLFALGVPQRLAEEISLELYRLRDEAVRSACNGGIGIADLKAKGVDYGALIVTRTSLFPCETEIDFSGLIGIEEDLVIRPFGWKGNAATIRQFTRGAAHNELGLQAVELVGNADGDFDGVTEELTVGDMTALSVYMAALERPTSMMELHSIGQLELFPEEIAEIEAGKDRFAEVGCSQCHVPTMIVENPVFSEPSRVPGFFDETFPDGSDPADHGLTPEMAVSFDLTADQPNNWIEDETGIFHLGALPMSPGGGAVAEWFTDFRRHDMGPDLADPDDPLGIGASVFLTRSLAGVGSTGPWLHDGRATTLDEAIRAHGGDASFSRDAYVELDETAQAELVAYLRNLVIFQAAVE